MSIRNRIIYGYAAVLGVTSLGIGIGLGGGDRLQHSARMIRQQASRERQLIQSLQVDILYNRPAKQLTPYVRNSAVFKRETSRLLQRVRDIQSKLGEHNQAKQTSQFAGLQTLLNDYEQTLLRFEAKVETFISETQPLLNTPTGAEDIQKQIVSLVKSSEFVDFIEFPNQLANYAVLAEESELGAEKSLQRAVEWRRLIIFSSLAVSIILAALLAFSISRAIANPILSVADVAQQVTRDSNFDLTVPVKNADEIGVLARSFNQLIDYVRQLIASQQSYVSKLESAKVDADAANRAKSEFLANMSHELRTPLNGILGYAQLLSQSNLSEEHGRGVSVIYQNGMNLLSQINDILDLAKIEARQMELTVAPMSLPLMLDGIAKLIRIKADQKPIRYIHDVPANIPFGISADEQRLRQALLNLLGNAIKFTDEGTVALSVRVEDLESDRSDNDPTESEDSFVRLSFDIKDTGVGISDTQMQTILLPFQQVGDTQKKAEGTGLGLTITNKILTLMGSRLMIKSKPGQGSSFGFEITVPRVKNVVDLNTEKSLETIIGYKNGRHRILVVDDLSQNRLMLRNLLSPIGFDVDEAENARDAIEIIDDCPPSLIITALSMPVMDGWGLLKHLRDDPTTPEIKVIVSTASVFASDREKSLLEGAHGFLPKPINLHELYGLVSKHLDLEWIYQETSKAFPEFLKDLSEQERCAYLPPADDLVSLLEIAIAGDIFGLKDRVKLLSEQSNANDSFYSRFYQLVNTFDINQVRATLESALAKKVDNE